MAAAMMVRLALITPLFIGGHVFAADPPQAEPGQPVLNWTSQDEDGVYGYIIYRASSEAGPFRRINPRIVARAKDGGSNEAAAASSRYRYVDTSAKAGQVYYYYIDVIAESGRKQRLTGVVRKGTDAR